MDEVDQAQLISDAHLDRALARQRAASCRDASALCRRYGEPIPEARRRAVMSPNCIECAREIERVTGA